MAGLPGHSAADDYGGYVYNGDYDYDDASLAASDATESGTSSQRSRQVALVRRSLNDGFGFTLRHFIAYPDEEDQDGLDPHSTPQESIFVSGVVPKGPAYQAGLQIGDRVISVNGLPAWDLSYADVVYQVQLSGLKLVLKVSPRDEDVVQLLWGSTAHHPASNLNMKFSHLPRPPPYRPAGNTPLGLSPLGSLSQAAVAVAAPHLTAAEDSASLNGERVGGIAARRPSTLSMPSLQMPPSVSGSTGSGLGSDHADANDPVYSRILKDVETKQQFLQRQPAQQWPAAPPQTPVVREYHVNPTRFPRTPWPPEAAAVAAGGGGGSVQTAAAGRTSSEQERRRRWQRAAAPATAPAGRSGQPPVFPSPRGGSLSVSSSADSLSSLHTGSVTNATARPYATPEPASSSSASLSASGAPEYVQYDAVTQVPRAKLPPPDHKLHIVSKRAKQFETGRVDNDTYAPGRSGYRGELELIAEPGRVPSVRTRRGEFERRHPDDADHGHRLQSVMSDPELDVVGRAEPPRDSTTSDQERRRAARQRYRRSYSCDGDRFVSSLEILLKNGSSDEQPRRPPRSGIGNRMVIVGGPRLHAEPLTDVIYQGAPKKPVRRRPDNEPSESSSPGGWPFAAADSAGRPLSKISEAEQETSPHNERKRNSAELIAGKVDEKKQKELSAVAMRSRPQHRALRQPSYMAAVKTPTPEARPSPSAAALTAADTTASTDGDVDGDGMAVNANGTATSDVPPPSSASPGDAASPVEAPRRRRPDFLPLTPCHSAGEASPAAPSPAPRTGTGDITGDGEESVLAADPDTQSPPIRTGTTSPPPLQPVKTSTPNTLVGAVRRQKQNGAGSEDDTDRAVRRVSYIRATGGDGLIHTGLKNDRTASTRVLKPSSPTWPSSASSAAGAATDATREGWLRVKLAMVDGRRAPDRSWKELWAVLRGDALSFYRDRKEVNQTPGSLEEQPVNVALCQLDAAEDYTRRKHVFRLLTHTRSEYLLQTEHLLERERWLDALRPICQQMQHEDSSLSVNDSTHLSPASVIRAKLSNRQRSPTGLAPQAKPRKQSHTPDQTSDSPKSKSWRGRMKRQIMKIHVTGSPQMPPATPIPDGATLNVPLELCPPSESNPCVPRIVELCTALVEERGLDSEGIYRVPGNNAAIKSLSAAVNRGIYDVDLQADPRWTDVNVISSLLKLFLRNLPDSLVTSQLYPKFIDTSKIEDPDRRRHLLRELVNRLPDHNYETLKHLLRHLKRVTDPVNQNKMDLKNLAIVFGPTLVRSSDDSTSALVTDMSQQCGIVKTLISEFDYYFPSEESDGAGEDQPPPLPESSPPMSAEILDGPARHSPLFSSAQRIDSLGAPLHPKDVVSSIILAASRKAQQQDGRPERAGSVGSDSTVAPSPVARCSISECNNNQLKRVPLSSCAAGPGTEVSPASSASAGARVHVIPIRLVEEVSSSGGAAQQAHGAEDPLATAARQRLSSVSASSLPGAGPSPPPSADDTAIRSYAGLSETTQERIRRFEEETRAAMLQRDKLREREARDLDMQRQRIEREWARAKQDLEHPDFLDELADNPADIARRIAELSTRLPGLTASATITAAAAAAAAAAQTNTSTASSVAAIESADRDDRLSVTSDVCERRPPSAWDTVSSGYSTMSSAGTGPRPGRARADSLPLRCPPGTRADTGADTATDTASPPAARADTGGASHPREPRRASESGERARWLAPSSRLYRSPRPVRRGGSAEDVAAAQTRKVELKRSEKALKARQTAEAQRPTARRRGSPSRDEGSSAEEGAEPWTASPAAPAPPLPTPAEEVPPADPTTSSEPLAAQESCDLVSSLVSTLDQKLQELGGRTPTGEEPKRASWSRDMYRDPSLHRSYSASCRLQMMTGTGTGSGSGSGGERTAPAPAPAAARDTPRASVAEHTKKATKRSIRQLCDRFEPRPAGPPRAARAAPGSPRALKRRHTVGGSKDIDKVLRLVLAASGAGSAAAGAGNSGQVVVRPASCLVELDLLPLQPVPLESRV